MSQKNVVKLHSMPWYHGPMGREDAEKLLVSKEDGSFLIRENAHFPGDFSLSMIFGNKFEHYRIMSKEINGNKKLTIDEESYFSNLFDLVAHYENDADGLVFRLIIPMKKLGTQAIVADKNDFKEWLIKKSDLKLIEVIGKGEFSEVHKANYGSVEVAVKIIKDSSMANLFLTEASIMTSLVHRCLVKFLGVVFESENRIYIVTEFMANGSLVDYLRSRGRAVISKSDQIRFARDTCSGMEFLEKKKFVHRDLAARNVLIHENGTAKVSDFGLALQSGDQSLSSKLPIKWTAPEALKKNKFTSKSDVWSFGILLWEIFAFGRVPYPKIPLSEVTSKVESGYRMEPPDGCPPDIYEIMQSTWNIYPDKRPTFTQILSQLTDMTSTSV